MGIVTSQAVRFIEWLVLVRFLQVRALGVMAIQTKRWRGLGQVKVELGLANLSRFMGKVASLASHIERRMPAAFLRHVHASLVATKAEVLFLVS